MLPVRVCRAAHAEGPASAGSAAGPSSAGGRPPKEVPLPGQGPISYPSQDPRQLGASYKKSDIASD